MSELAGAVVIGMAHGEERWIEARGLESLEHRTFVTSKSRFMVGSVAKQFLGAAACAAVRDGFIELSTLAAEYCPFLQLKHVTLRDLLTHTSGVRETEALFALAGLRENDFVSPEDHFEALTVQTVAMQQNGSRFSYANINYLIAAEMLRKATGDSLNSLCGKLIFEPMGLMSTLFAERPDEVIPHKCESYLREGDTIRRAQATVPTAGPSGLWSTPCDLLAWAAVRQSALKGAPSVTLAPKEARAMLAWPSASSGRYNGGVVEGRTSDDSVIVGHAGDDQGYSSQLLSFGDVHIVALSSISGLRAADLIERLWKVDAFRAAVAEANIDRARPSTTATLARVSTSPEVHQSQWQPCTQYGETPAELSGEYVCGEALAPVELQVEGSRLTLRRGARRDILTRTGQYVWNGPGYILHHSASSPYVIELELRRAGVLHFRRK